MRGKMHSAKIESSPRLQRVYEALQQRPMTTMELIKAAGVCAVNSIIAELRANNIDIECERIKRGVYRYRLVGLF